MAVHVLEYILALSILLRTSFKHISQDASAETIVGPPKQSYNPHVICKYAYVPLRGAYL